MIIIAGIVVTIIDNIQTDKYYFNLVESRLERAEPRLETNLIYVERLSCEKVTFSDAAGVSYSCKFYATGKNGKEFDINASITKSFDSVINMGVFDHNDSSKDRKALAIGSF
ncbi:hypothetical protein AB4Z50_34990 [Paenibacillus sp. 2TAB26]|uniref:hypothetical protein n=1 Tax=Paenibacillus sp. 2TAB26 TaxID=3233005 RepID=UPI003F9580DE